MIYKMYNKQQQTSEKIIVCKLILIITKAGLTLYYIDSPSTIPSVLTIWFLTHVHNIFLNLVS